MPARAAVAVFAVVVDQMIAHRLPGRALILVADGGVDIDAARVRFLAEDVVDEHAGHFGRIFGVHVGFGGRLIARKRAALCHERRLELGFVRELVDVLQIAHAL